MNKAALALLLILAVFATGCTGAAAAASLDTSRLSTGAPVAGPSAAALASSTPTVTALFPFPVTPRPTPNALSTSYEDAATIMIQLAAGTLELDGTDQAVTKDQAIALLPLWRNYLSLGQAIATPVTGTTGSESQADEVVDEIELMMTPTQLNAIADLQITQQSVVEALALVTPTAEAQSTADETATTQLVSAVVQYLQEMAAG